MRVATAQRLTVDQLRDGEPGLPGLAMLGLSESPIWIDGFQFTPFTTPQAACESYRTLKGVAPTRFCLNANGTFNLTHY